MKIKTNINGQPTEIEVADEEIVAAGFQPTANFEKELGRRAISIAKKQGLMTADELKAQLLDDETFVQSVLDSKGIKPGQQDAGETATAIQDAVKRNRQEWESRELAPTRAKLEEFETREQSLLVKDLHRQIIQAAAQLGIKKALLKSPTRGSAPPIVSMLETAFGFDTDTGEFYVLDGEGFAFSDKPSKDNPYKTVEEFVEQWTQDKENSEFLDVQSQGGPRLQGTLSGGRAGAGAVHISRADSRNLRLLQAAKAEATKRGLDPSDGGVIID